MKFVLFLILYIALGWILFVVGIAFALRCILKNDSTYEFLKERYEDSVACFSGIFYKYSNNPIEAAEKTIMFFRILLKKADISSSLSDEALQKNKTMESKLKGILDISLFWPYVAVMIVQTFNAVKHDEETEHRAAILWHYQKLRLQEETDRSENCNSYNEG